MRSSFFSRPPLRLIWNTENFISASAEPLSRRLRPPQGAANNGERGESSFRSSSEAGRALHVFLGVGHHVVELQPHLLADRQFRVAALAFTAELLLQREHRLWPRQRIQRHAPLH